MNKQLPIRILQCTSQLSAGGVQRFLIKYGEELLSKGIIFDYVVQTDEEQVYDKVVIDSGSVIFHVTPLADSVFLYIKDIYKILRDHSEYQIVHVHLNFASIAALIAAKFAGVKVRICHSHNNYEASSFKSRVARKIFWKMYPLFATDCWACGKDAAKWLYGEKNKGVSIIHNAIDTNLYAYDEQLRACVRRNLDITGKTVWVHIGMFGKAKNHQFLLDLFSEFLENNTNSVLLLCGSGEEEDKIHRKLYELGIRDNVIELGMVRNVQDYYMAADVMVFPSLYEGLPYAIVEAQATGLPCVVSEAVTEEVCLENVYRVAGWDECVWLKEIENVLEEKPIRKEKWKIIKETGYDLYTEANALAVKYQSLYEGAIHGE